MPSKKSKKKLSSKTIQVNKENKATPKTAKIVLFVFGVGPLILFYRPLTIIPSIAAASRRLHDINMTGKWSMLLITPFAPFIMLLLIKKGNTKKNQYGNPPY